MCGCEIERGLLCLFYKATRRLWGDGREGEVPHRAGGSEQMRARVSDQGCRRGIAN